MARSENPATEPLGPMTASRRTLLKVTGAGGAALAFSSAPAARASAAVPAKRRAYVIVLDGCRPGEVLQMPRTNALRSGGRWYPRARSHPIRETIPNHVMMMTGVRPDRSGVPANEIYDRTLGDTRTVDRPTDIRVTTVIEQANARGLVTGTVLSKTYLYDVFGTRATHRWEPFPVVPVSGHAPDQATMQATRSMVEQFDPSLVFVNLGNIDRFGHSDVTGTTLKAARAEALRQADEQIGGFVDLLRSSGRWESSMLLFVADHSMDWSLPQRIINLDAALGDDAAIAGKYAIAQNGGADLVYWTGPSSGRAAGVARIKQVAAAVPGVLEALDRTDPVLRLGPTAGDVVVHAQAGWRFSDPTPLSNPIPGNHGHPATRPIPFFLSGGHPGVRGGALPHLATTVDVAPTVGAFLGVPAPASGWEGRNRL